MTGAQKPSIGRWLKGLLLLQGAIALLLIVTDLEARWPFGLRLDQPSSPSGPVSPGDQVRPYDPERPVPQLTNPGARPGFDMPDDLPPRLEFTLQSDDDGTDLILMNGAITAGDADRFAAYLDSLQDLPATVALNSPGGIVDEALAIGRLIRSRELDTRMVAGTVCFSACPYMLSGGVARQVSASAAVGLHQHYYQTPGYMPVYFAVENIQRGQGATMAYLIEMGIDPGVMVYGLTTPPDDIYVLVESELLESRIATEMID